MEHSRPLLRHDGQRFRRGNIIPVQADATGVVAGFWSRTNKVKPASCSCGSTNKRQGDARSFAADLAARRALGRRPIRRAAPSLPKDRLANRAARQDPPRRHALSPGAAERRRLAQVLQNATDQLASLAAELHQSRADFQSFERGSAG